VNIMARNVAPGGSPASTRAATARISGNVLQICDDDFEVVQPQFCSVGSLRSYTLTVSDDVFTASAAAPEFPSFDFRVARMGSSNVMLAAGPSSLGAPETGTLQLLIGLPESAGLLDSTVKGPAVGTTGASDWVTVQVTRATYASLGASINDVAGLSRPGVESPFSMLNGNPLPTLGGAPIWVMQSYPLIVVSGSFLGSPSASGLLQLGLP
jgi:hypothetical protein